MSKEPLAEILGRNLRAYREELGMSQEQFAHERYGKSRGYLGQVERGERNLSLAGLRELAEICGVAPAELITERCA